MIVSPAVYVAGAVMAAEHVSLYGTPLWERMSLAQQIELSRQEIVNIAVVQTKVKDTPDTQFPAAANDQRRNVPGRVGSVRGTEMIRSRIRLTE